MPKKVKRCMPIKTEETKIFKFLKKHYSDFPQSESDGTPTNKLCLKGHVLLVYLQNQSSPAITVRQVSSLFGITVTKLHILELVRNLNKYKSNLSKNLPLINQLCSEIFRPLPTATASNPDSTINNATSVPQTLTAEVPSASSNSSIDGDDMAPRSLIPPTEESSACSYILRGNVKMTPREKTLKRRLSLLSQFRRDEKCKYRKTVADLKSKSNFQPKLIKTLKRTIRRQRVRITALKNEIKEFRVEARVKQCAKMKLLYLKERKKNQELLKQLKKSHSQKEVAERDELIHFLQNEKLLLEERLEELEEDKN
ncbi:uncharacterized protein LOC106076412 [Biomphalaria glabrata]|uniref:Uncharacterized protein LOC106076412 n=1 Tax=Biomphalaria glabrata TaxID=6526 RepID=A0A2C9M1F4_BIOGL|nr:uncharacterized protein LOC106076412 [Biomphalaria glabrata]